MPGQFPFAGGVGLAGVVVVAEPESVDELLDPESVDVPADEELESLVCA
jgi:hypothetical protein